MASTRVLLTTGELLEVDGTVEDVAKALENAARSSAGSLAWLKEGDANEPVGVNPSQVVTVRAEPS